jgi:hypothetical protein
VLLLLCCFCCEIVAQRVKFRQNTKKHFKTVQFLRRKHTISCLESG